MTRAKKIEIVNHALQGIAIGLIVVTVVLIMALLNGCAAKRPLRFHAQDIQNITYRYDKCKPQANGTFKCDDVVFSVGAIDIGPSK